MQEHRDKRVNLFVLALAELLWGVPGAPLCAFGMYDGCTVRDCTVLQCTPFVLLPSPLLLLFQFLSPTLPPIHLFTYPQVADLAQGTRNRSKDQ